jgi:hypothetical protein
MPNLALRAKAHRTKNGIGIADALAENEVMVREAEGLAEGRA